MTVEIIVLVRVKNERKLICEHGWKGDRISKSDMTGETNTSGKRNMSQDTKQKMADGECHGCLGSMRGWNAESGIVKVDGWRQTLKPDFRKHLFWLRSL